MEALVYTIIIGGFLFSTLIEILNLKNIRTTVPKEFVGYYNEEQYAKSQKYLKVSTRFGLLQGALSTIILVAFIALGGFNVVDIFLREYFSNPVVLGLFYIG